MNASALESLICSGLAFALAAQHKATPALDLCTPGMVSDEKRRQIVAARHDLATAWMNADYAAKQFQAASIMLAEYLNPEAK